VKAQAEQQAALAKTAEAAKGEQAAPLVKAAVQQHRSLDQRALVNFEDDPELYEGALKTMLTCLAERNQAFATQLQTAAQQANLQTGGVQGSVNIYGGKVDQAAGVNTGTMTYHAGKDEDA